MLKIQKNNVKLAGVRDSDYQVGVLRILGEIKLS